MANRDMNDCGFRLDAGDVLAFDLNRAHGLLVGEAERQAKRPADGEVQDIEYMGGGGGPDERKRWTEAAETIHDLQRRNAPLRNEKLPV